MTFKHVNTVTRSYFTIMTQLAAAGCSTNTMGEVVTVYQPIYGSIIKLQMF